MLGIPKTVMAGLSPIALSMAITLMQGWCMKVSPLPTANTPSNTFQKKIKPEPPKEAYGQGSLSLLGTGAKAKDSHRSKSSLAKPLKR